MSNTLTEAVILAGGLGTRLAHVVANRQKVMAPVNGEPFLTYLLNKLQNAGLRRVILAAGYRHEQISSYYKNRCGELALVYSVEDTPLGTGGAVKKALSLCQSQDILLLNGDTFFDIDYGELYKAYQKSGAQITLGVKPLYNFERYGTVEFNGENTVLCFLEKKKNDFGYINGGVYIISKSLAQTMPEGKFSLETELLEPNRVKETVYVSNGFFIDIGIAEDYFKAQTLLPLSVNKNSFRAVFLDRDGVLCKEKHHLYKIEDFEWIEGAKEALKILCALGYLTVVVTNQAGVAKGYYTEEDVNRLHGYIKEQLREFAPAPAFYYCPYHPDGRVEAYQKSSDCRKPAPGMLIKAVKDFERQGINIDLSASYMVGDTVNDLLAGKNAGIGKTVLVKTGHPVTEEAIKNADVVADSLYRFAESLILLKGEA